MVADGLLQWRHDDLGIFLVGPMRSLKRGLAHGNDVRTFGSGTRRLHHGRSGE